jgi:hypothetical protein
MCALGRDSNFISLQFDCHLLFISYLMNADWYSVKVKVRINFMYVIRSPRRTTEFDQRKISETFENMFPKMKN